MAMEGHLREGQLRLDLRTPTAKVFGIYGDFSETIGHMVRHALGGPTPSPVLIVRTVEAEGLFRLALEDEGGPLLPEGLEHAFEPFSGLREDPVLGVRKPGSGLPACVQLMASYKGTLELRNEGEGTYLSLSVPVGQGA